MRIDPIKRALQLRKTLKKDDKILVTEFSDTLQGVDTSKVIDLMPIVGRDEYVFRAKVNVKGLDPIASEKYGVEFFDITKKTDAEIEAYINKQEFDFPLWFKQSEGFSMQKVCDYNPPFILQVAGCNFHDGSATGGCWYCFVDDKSNDGAVCDGKTYLGTEETIDSMLAARDKIRTAYKEVGKDLNIKVLRTSGGEPTIVLDWILDLWRKIGERDLDFVGQLDSNLSTGKVVERFEKEGIYEKNILNKLAEYPVKVLTALKGVDKENLQSNVQSTATMKAQLHSLKRFLEAGFDIYPQMYNPNPKTLESYLKRMDEKIENLSLRIHIGPLKVYGPTEKRIELAVKECDGSLDKIIAHTRYKLDEETELWVGRKVSPKELKKIMQENWDDNYRNSCEVIDAYLRKTHGVGYKEVTRSDVMLRIK